LSNMADMGRTGAAAATDDLRTGSGPLSCLVPVFARIAGAGPTAMLRIPAFARIRINNNRLLRDRMKLFDERTD